MNTYKEFSKEQEAILTKLGFENSVRNTWYKNYGCDDSNEDEVGFALILNPYYGSGKVKINYCRAIDTSYEIDDTKDVSEIYKDITALIEQGLIKE